MTKKITPPTPEGMRQFDFGGDLPDAPKLGLAKVPDFNITFAPEFGMLKAGSLVDVEVDGTVFECVAVKADWTDTALDVQLRPMKVRPANGQ